MDLPGVKRRQVESLGRQNSQLAIQEGRSKVAVTNAVVNTFDDVNTAFDNAVVKPNYEREAIAQYAKAEYSRVEAMAETEAILSNPTGMVDASLVPDEIDFRRYDKDAQGIDVRREQIPAHEVAGDWYKRQLRTTQEAALAEMTNAHAIRKVKNDYSSGFMDNYARVLVNAQKQKQEYDRAELDVSVEKFLEGGNLGKAETLMLGAMKTGTIGQAEGTAKLMAMPGDVDAYRTERAINLSTISELDHIETYIYRDFNVDLNGEVMLDDQGVEQQNPMSFDQRNGLIAKLNARRVALTSKYKKDRDDGSERALNEQLILLQENREPLDEVTLRRFKNSMSASDHQTLITANKALKSTVRGESDPDTMSRLQRSINKLSMPQVGQPVDMSHDVLMQDINQALDDNLINAGDANSMIQRVLGSEVVQAETRAKAKEMEFVTDQIYKRLTQGSKDNMGMNTSAEDALNAADAEAALYAAALQHGSGFSPLAWMQNEFDDFLTTNLANNMEDLAETLASKYLVRGEDGRFDEIASRQKLAEATEKGIPKAVLKAALADIAKRVKLRDVKAQLARDKAAKDAEPWYNFIPGLGE